MTDLEKRQNELAGTNQQVEGAECNQIVANTEKIEENKTMCELEFTEFDDRTYRTEAELTRFLNTLTEAQLAEAEIIVDDDTFVVFYPLLPKVAHSGFHFDTDYIRPTVASAEVPALIGMIAEQTRPAVTVADRQAGLAILLASVRL